MIHDVDASLAALIRAEALAGGEAEVVFDPPTKEWASRRHAPAVDVFLYDIREDVTRRDITGCCRSCSPRSSATIASRTRTSTGSSPSRACP
jgi:hypothetical protein